MSATLSTHVLDTARGAPAAGVGIRLYRVDGARLTAVGDTVTNADGRSGDAFAPVTAGTYALVFAVEAYFARTGTPAFYDEITVRFRVDDGEGDYHVPLLLSPWGYATYRGS